jgi:hypothetical protein
VHFAAVPDVGAVFGHDHLIRRLLSTAAVAVELPRERRAGVAEPERVGLPVGGEAADGQRSNSGGRGRHDERSD